MDTMINTLLHILSAYPMTNQTVILVVFGIIWIICSTIRDYDSHTGNPSTVIALLAFLFGLLTAVIVLLMFLEIIRSGAYRQSEFLGVAVLIWIIIQILCRSIYRRAVNSHFSRRP